ncbi:hypothetical protein PM082_000692 [Marasmius tenuissimus]|nr:hypothetical protein PM082_000692 [Marasmius tenuissimus]
MARDEGDTTLQPMNLGGGAMQNACPANSRRLRNTPTPKIQGQSTSNIDDARTVQALPPADPTPQTRELPRGDDESVAEPNEGAPTAQHTAMNQTHDSPTSNERGRMGKNTKAHLTIGALNMRGLRSMNFNNPKNKWYHINQLMCCGRA